MFSLYLLILAPLALAQTATNAVPSSSSLIPFSSSSSFPGSQPTGSNGNNSNDTGGGGLNTYYAVGLALLLCCVALALFFMFRRRALEMRARRRNGGRALVLQRDLNGAVIAGDPSRGRGYLVGLRRPVETSPEEGLNERGEAPPQYISKSEWEETHGIGGNETGGPSIPLQTLSHGAAGLPSKPPDYTESSTREVDSNGSTSTATGSVAESLRRGGGAAGS